MDRNVKGLLGEKLGMTQVWDESNKVVPVTVIKAGPNVVTTVRTPEKDGYSAVQLAFGEIDPRKVNKPEQGHFAKAGVTPRRHLVELRTLDANNYTVGQELNADVFTAGDAVDVTGTSRGHGFAGVMKRHGFPWTSRFSRCGKKTQISRFNWCMCNTWSSFQRYQNGWTYGFRSHHHNQFDCGKS